MPHSKNVKLDTVCPMVWDHLCINTAGKNRLCCNSKTQDNDYFQTNFDNHWNQFRENIKKEMLQGGRPDVCSSCWKKEDAGITSLRQAIIRTYQSRKEWENFLNRLDLSREFPVELDLKLGNYCNLACRMCNSYSSSKNATELKKIWNDTGIDIGVDDYEKYYVQKKWYLEESFIESINKMITNGLRDLKFTGGEPLMVPGVKKIIEFCINSGYADNIYLTLITNVTLIDQEWVNKLKKFKFVNIICSIDGTGKTYEYIRDLASWKDVNTRLNLLFNTATANMRIDITFTLQIYNMLEIESMVNLSKNYNCKITAIVLDTPSYLDVRNAPEKLKLDALTCVDKLFFNTNNSEKIKEFLKNIKNAINRPATEDTIEKFKTITLLKDRYKNQNSTKMKFWKYYS